MTVRAAISYKLILCFPLVTSLKYFWVILWFWQLKRSPPRNPPRAPLRDERPKAKPKRPLRDEESEDANAIDLIRQMFR